MDQEEIIKALRSYDPSFDEQRIRKAIKFAIHNHEGQTRASGEPYYLHPLNVADIIISMRLDSNSVITALLHDIVEDTELTLEDIRKNFGEEVAKLVDGVTKLSKIEFMPDHIRQAENFRKLLLAMSDDIRVLLVKLADRLHNMRTIQHIKSPEKRTRIALETMEIYAPLAERIGVQKIKVELQDICFSILEPSIRDAIIKRLENLIANDNQFIASVEEEIQDTIKKEDIVGEVYGRYKTPYSIWMKMQQKNLSIEQLSDIIAFRIIVNTHSECYQVLGAIHTKYQMVPENFQDFISTPKNNSYQSLHTVVIGPMKQKIEIQIRTHKMHEVAELGVAAHWRYKQNYLEATDGKQYKWLRELLGILEDNVDSEEFLQNTKLAMYYDQVFCFTPNGTLIALPKGASVIDFAYAVHSNIGNHCTGAKINGKLVSLKTHLKNGDQIEILTSKTQTPSPAWEKIVITGKARSEIRRFTKGNQRAEHVKFGKSILDKAFKTAGFQDITKSINDACVIFKRNKAEDLYYDVAKGMLMREDVVEQLLPKKSKINSTLDLLKLTKKSKAINQESILINELSSGMAVHFAGCCHPLPPDLITGVIHSGRGITVHKKNCTVLANFATIPNTIINLSWDNEKTINQFFICRLKVKVLNEPGALALFTSELAKEKININNFKITQRSADFFEFYTDVEVNNLNHVNRLIDHLKEKQSVHSIERVEL